MRPMRDAACNCGQLRLTAEGDPVRISMCHCLACQRRTGSAFSMQARFPREQVTTSGRSSTYLRVADSGVERTFHFCPDCAATVFYENDDSPGLIAITIGTFADPSFPQPLFAVWERRRHAWIALPMEGMEHED